MTKRITCTFLPTPGWSCLRGFGANGISPDIVDHTVAVNDSHSPFPRCKVIGTTLRLPTVPTASKMAQAYIISRAADPIFALFIGLSAAALRINREEKAKGKTTSDILEAARR